MWTGFWLKIPIRDYFFFLSPEAKAKTSQFSLLSPLRWGTEGWIHALLSGLPLLLISLTRGLQHFLPAHQEILKPDPTVSHGDLLEEVGHSSVLLPLLSHPPPSRMNLCPVSILRIKEEAHLSTEAELPGSTDVSIIFTLTCHPALQGERVCPCGGKVLSLWV